MAKSTSANDFMGDRYKYDFSICTLDKGWAQLGDLLH